MSWSGRAEQSSAGWTARRAGQGGESYEEMADRVVERGRRRSRRTPGRARARRLPRRRGTRRSRACASGCRSTRTEPSSPGRSRTPGCPAFAVRRTSGLPSELEHGRRRRRAGRCRRRPRAPGRGRRSGRPTDSMPTESRMRLPERTASGESARLAWVMRPGCSIRLSTPPRLSPSCQIRVALDAPARILLGAGELEARSCRRSRASAGARARAAGWVGSPG